MRQKTFLILLLAVLWVTTGWFGGKESRADELPIATECVITDSNGIQLVPTAKMEISPGIDEDGNSIWPVPVDCVATLTKSYDWKYKTDFTTWGQGVTLIPVCSPELNVSVAGGQFQLPGTGDPTTGFGKGIFTDRAVRVASTNTAEFVAFNTLEEPLMRNATWQFKIGKNLYYCPAIAGPGCTLPGVLPVSSDTESTVGNFRIKVFRSRVTGCGFDVKYKSIDELGEPWLPTTIEELIPGHTQVDCGSIEGNQACRECIQTYHSPFPCSSITVAGKQRNVPVGYDANRDNKTADTIKRWKNSDTGALYSEACPYTPPVWPCDGQWRQSTSGLNPSPPIDSCNPSGTPSSTCSTPGARRCTNNL